MAEIGLWLKQLKDIKQNHGALVGLMVVGLFVLFAVSAPWVAPHGPSEVFAGKLKMPPAWQEGGDSFFLLGTDDLGRDVFSRLLYGSQVSLGIGFFVVFFSTVWGVILGLLAGSFAGGGHGRRGMGSWIDQVVMRSMDIIMALPSVLLAVVIVTLLGPGLVSTVLAVGIVALPSVVRLVRSSVLVEKSKNYVVASRTFGANWWQIHVNNILPNITAPLIVQITLGFSDGILNAAALGFLGLGAQPPTPEWGTILSDGRSYIESSPTLVIFPGLCILFVVLAFNLLGDGLRDSLDPKLRKAE